MTPFSFIFRLLRKAGRVVSYRYHHMIAIAKLKGNGVSFGRNLRSSGVPKVDVVRTGQITIGENFKMNNGGRYNMIGRQQPCHFIVSNSGCLTIGDNVGISASAIVCSNSITIGDNVKIGGNCVIYDTDFHSLNKETRRDVQQDSMAAKTAPVIIGNDAFIGAHSTILKGVTIGAGAIVGSCSLVTKNIPENELWAGSPAKYIRSLL